jgi:tetratricopeptide (TPR) repeat protein
MELKDSVYNQILFLSEQGDTLTEAEDYIKAIGKYKEALDLVPNPKYEWEASTWLYTALGDACYLNNQYNEALAFLFETLKCPNGLMNPYVFLRIGECFYELGNEEKAKEYLLQAYMIQGGGIFEDEDEKYFEMLKDLV